MQSTQRLGIGLLFTLFLVAACTAIQEPTPTPIDPRQPLPTPAISAQETVAAPTAAPSPAATEAEAAAADEAIQPAEEEAVQPAEEETIDEAETEAAADEAADEAAGDEDELISTGEEIYAAECASCHQSDGQGDSNYPALVGSELVTAEDPSEAIAIVHEGRGQMPAFSDTLEDEEIAAVVSYIRNAWDNNASAVSVEQVAQGEAGESAAAEAEATPADATTAEAASEEEQETTTEEAQALTPQDQQLISAGEEVYAIHCASCHQINGQGTSAFPALDGSGMVTAEDPAGVIQIILHGRGHMPAFADTLSDQEVAAVTSLIRNAWDNNASPVSVEQVSQVQTGETTAEAEAPAEEEAVQPTEEETTAETEAVPEVATGDEEELISMGEEIYAAQCASCHQDDGQGNSNYPALAGSELVTAEDPSEAITIVHEGRGQMPAFSDTLEDEEIAAVVSYIRTAWDNAASAVTVEQISEEPADAAAPAETDEPTPEADATPEAEATPETEATPEPEATPEAEATPAPTAPAAMAVTVRGDEIYRTACAACHQPHGQGTERYPALAGSAIATAEDPAEPIMLVLQGPGEMPSFAGNLSNQEIAAVLSYVRSTWGNQAAAVNVDQVQQSRTGEAAAPAAETTPAAEEDGAMAAEATSDAEAEATPATEETTATAEETDAVQPAEEETTTETEATLESTPETETAAPPETEATPAAETTPAAEATPEPDAAETNGAATAPSDEELLASGDRLYQINCAACHQLSGQGTSAFPALAGNPVVTNQNPSAAIAVVLQGRGHMPAFANRLDDQAIAAVVSHIRNAWENGASIVSIDQVTQVRDGETAAAETEATPEAQTTPDAAATPEVEATPEAETTPTAEATPAAAEAAAPAEEEAPPATEAEPDDTAGDNEELISMGEEVYAAQCASCHQNDGQGASSYPALAGSQLVTAEDPSETIAIVHEGRGQMPAFGDSLSDEEIAAVVSYIRNAWDNDASIVSVEQISQDQDGVTPAEEGEATPANTPEAETPTDAETTPAAETPTADEATPAAEMPPEAEEPEEAAPPQVEMQEEEAVAEETTTEPDPIQLVRMGGDLYIRYCAACHQAAGQGVDGVYPPLAGNPLVLAEDPASVVNIILHGRGGMPSFRNDLTAEELAAITSYIRNPWGNQAAPVKAAQVRALEESSTTNPDIDANNDR